MIKGNGRNVAQARFPTKRETGERQGPAIISLDDSRVRTNGSGGRKKIGVALSCGGAKGLAHVGVIGVLEELGIKPDFIAGSSMGAYVAALWAKGYDSKEIGRMAHEYRGMRGALTLMDLSFWPLRGLLRGRRIEKGLRKRLDGAHFEDLSIPLLVPGTDMDSLETVWFEKGDVASAVRASCSLPGIFAPKKIGGTRFVDGGIADPLPVEKLREMGADVVIASNVLVPPDARKELGERSRNQRRLFAKRRPILNFLHQAFNPFSFGNALQVLDRCVQIGQARKLAESMEQADVVIDAYSFYTRWFEFYKPGRFLALGRRAALSKLPALLESTETENPTLTHQA